MFLPFLTNALSDCVEIWYKDTKLLFTHVHWLILMISAYLNGYFGVFNVIFGQKVHENEVFAMSQECISWLYVEIWHMDAEL